tara:strand:- start:3437 stop:4006 length:570 start_codon:yes stop_codon:yes gene_type:complete
MKFVFTILILISSLSCSEEYSSDNGRDQIPSEIIELPALRTNSRFNQPYRILKTTISDSSVFDENYGNLEISIGYVLRYYFYTAIDLNSDKNELISMDRSTFTMPDTSDSVELIRAAISEISNMTFGSQENAEFISKYFDGCIDLTKINKTCVAPTVIDPVCGCDGFTYNNSTLAGCAGLISYSLGSCD